MYLDQKSVRTLRKILKKIDANNLRQRQRKDVTRLQKKVSIEIIRLQRQKKQMSKKEIDNIFW